MERIFTHQSLRQAKWFICIFALLFAHAVNAVTYSVNSLSDANTGSGTSGTLRYCITQANLVAGPHIINFDPAGTGTITLSSPLPDITQRMTINGYSASGALAGPFATRVITVQIIGPVGATSILNIRASNTVISGINFISFQNGGFPTSSIFHDNANTNPVTGVWVWGCSFNTNLAGTAVYPNAGGLGFGIYGNTSAVGGASNLSGWIIGVNGDGTNDDREGNQFTSPDPALGSFAFNDAIRLQHLDNFIIAGNYFGLQKDGVTPIMNYSTTAGQNYHISLTNVVGTRIGTDRNGTSDALERNILVGARGDAIVIFANNNGGSFGGTASTTLRNTGNNQIYGNYIGTDITGLATGANLANRSGIRLNGTSNNIIGVNSAAGRNVIVNSIIYGVGIVGSIFYTTTVTSSNNSITGNYIGVLANGTSPSGNGNGVQINANNIMTTGNISATNNTVSQNIIANSSGAGVTIQASTSNPVQVYYNRVTQNSIYDNGGLGINVSSAAFDQIVSPNNGTLSAITSTTSVNESVDYGIISNMGLNGNNLFISGYIGNNPSGNTAFANATVEFFIADNSPSNQNGARILGDGLSVPHGEGRTYIGSLTSDANGLFSGTLNVTGFGVAIGTEITNTVTLPSFSTSEFGVNVTVGMIQGNVFNDMNGNALVDGIGTNIATTLYAVLYNVNTGAVEAFSTVSSDGAYSLSNVSGLNYSIYLTTTLPVIGQTATPIITLPNGWINTGEQNCGTTAGCSGNDGTPDGVLSLGVVSNNITQANFGIKQSVGYIYVHKKALNEESSINFPFSISGGPTSVPDFNLNDITGANAIIDVGVSQDGTLWAVGWGATGNGGPLFYRLPGSDQWMQHTGVSTAYRVDGGPGGTAYMVNNQGASGTPNGYMYQLTPTTITLINPAQGWSDVGSSWDGRPFGIYAGNLYKYPAGATGSVFWNQLTNTGDLVAVDGDPTTGDIIGRRTNNNIYRYTLVAAPTVPTVANTTTTLMGQPSVPADRDVAVSGDGTVYASTQNFVYRWTGGTSWASEEPTSRKYASRITGGQGNLYYGTTNETGVGNQHKNIYTRLASNTDNLWVSMDRVRLGNKSNSIAIPVAAGTYTVTELVPTGWDLTDLQVYDPSGNSTTNLVGNTATINVSEGETVGLIFENTLVNPFLMTQSCTAEYLATFGSGAVGSFGPALTGQTSYHYQSSGQSFSNNYAVVGNANLLFSGAANLNDHTSGNGTGYMMAVDANNEKDAFFRRRFRGVIPGASYEFSAWIANINVGALIKPNVTFLVINPATYDTIQSYNTGNITTSGWNKYSLTFVAADSTFDLVIKNAGNGGSGNDLALDDIRFALIPPTDPLTTVVNSQCDLSLGSITVTSPLGASFEYSKDSVSWQPSPVFDSLTPGNYRILVRYAGSNGCVISKRDTVRLSICGNVFLDNNGLTDGTVNGTSTNLNGDLKAVLYNVTTGRVDSIVAISPTGTYSFLGTAGSNYTVYLTSSNSNTIGQTAIPTVTLPSNYANTGENIGAGVGNDGSVNGILPLGVRTQSVNNVNFGIADKCNILAFGLVDTDGDAVADICDLDDDNDGILDTVESLCGTSTVSLAPYDNQTAAGVIFTNNVIKVGESRISLVISTFGSAGINTNGINDEHIAGEIGVRLGHGGSANSFNNRIRSVYSFNGPVSDFTFKLHDIDAGDLIRVSLLDQNNDTIDLTTSHFTFDLSDGATIVSFNDATNTFSSPSTDISNRRGTVIFDLAGLTVSSIILDYWDVNSNGTYTFLPQTGTGCSAESDFDGDGIPNSLDLDSDNDGCPDAVEGGANFTYANLVNSSINGGNTNTTSGTYNQPVVTNLGNTVDVNGIPTIAGTGQTVGTSQNSTAFDPACFVEVTGSVFNDANGNTVINAGENFSSLPAPLYVYLVDSNGIVMDSAVVQPNGTYTLNAVPNQDYSIELSQVQYPIGLNTNNYPLVTTPPAGFVNTGENGAGNTGPGDLNPDGKLTVTVGTSNVSQQNFGLGDKCSPLASGLVDTDGDGITDVCDLDDDNDGIPDTAENDCINTLVANYPANFYMIKPSDFGINFTGTPQIGFVSLTADLSDKFGYPANSGAIIVNVKNANVHPTADAFYNRGDLGVTDWEVTGTLSTILTAEQGLEYFPFQRREIRLYNYNAQIVNQTPLLPGTWVSGVEGNTYYQYNNTNTEYSVATGMANGAVLFTASIETVDKSFGTYTNDIGLSRWSTYFVRIAAECDYDKDGIPNRLDKDSDNDGCVDAIEGGGSFDYNDLDSTGSLSGSVSTGGIPIIAGTGQTTGTSQDSLVNSCNTTYAVNDENSTFVNTPVGGNVLTNDYDLEGHTQTFGSFLNPTSTGNITSGATVSGVDLNGNPVANAGTLTFDANGNYTFTPATGFTGVAQVPYNVCDNGNIAACDTAILEITVSPLPADTNSVIANNDEYTTQQGSTVNGNIVLNDDDPQGDNFSVTTYSYDSNGDGTPDATGTIGSPQTVGGISPTGDPIANAGSLTLNSNGTFTFVPSPSFVGEVDLTYTICDNGTPQACSETTVTITVVPDQNGAQNDPPVAGDDFSYTNINTPTTGNFVGNDNDLNGDPLSVNGTTINTAGPATPIDTLTTAQGGTVVMYANGTYTYTPPTDYIGPDQVVYTVCDVTVVEPQPLCADATIHLLVGAQNTTNAVNDENSTFVNTPVGGNVTTNDFDLEGDNQTFGTFLNPITSAPLASGSIVSGFNSNGVFVLNAGTLTFDANGNYVYTPAAGFTGNVLIDYTICDDAVLSVCDTATLAITVSGQPSTTNVVIANNDEYFTTGDDVIGNVTINDSDPQGDNFEVITYTYDSNGDGTFDATGTIGSPTTVSGINENGQFVANAGTLTLNPDGSFTFVPTDGFKGEVNAIYTIEDDGTPVADDQAILTITVISDINGTKNDPPVAGDDFSYTYINTPVTGNFVGNDSDLNGDPISVNGTTINPAGPATPIDTLTTVQGGTVVLNSNGTYTYTPPTGYTGPDRVVYTICDVTLVEPQPLCADATIHMLVGTENTTYAVNDENSTFINTPVDGNVLTNDYDLEGDTQSFGSFLNPSGTGNITSGATVSGVDQDGNPVANAGTLTFDANGNYTFTPANGFTGVVSVPYSITDDGNPMAADTAILQITVSPLPTEENSVIANNDEYTTQQGTTVNGNIVLNDADPQGDNFSVTTYSYNSNGDGTPDATGTVGTPQVVGGVNSSGAPVANAGTLTMNSDGTFTFVPTPSFVGEVNLTYTICDDGTPQACSETTITITVVPDQNGVRNDPPVAGDDFSYTNINTPVTGNFVGNDSDLNGDPISVNGTTINPAGPATPIQTLTTEQGGTVVLNSDGTYTYTPPTDYVGPDNVVYTICDVTAVTPQPLCADATIHLLVGVATIDVSGNIFNDVNGNTILNAGDAFATLPAPMYVYLLDSNGIVVDSAHVQPDGSYTLSASPNQDYTLVVSTVQYPIGYNDTASPINTDPPSGWATIGENGLNNTGTGDGLPNGRLPLELGTTSVENQNFAIAPIPVADDKSFIGLDPNTLRFTPTNNLTYPNAIPLNNIAGSMMGDVSSVDGTMPGTVTGTDYNAGPIGATAGQNNSMTFATDGIIYDPNNSSVVLTNTVVVYNFEGDNFILTPNPSPSDPSYVFWNPTTQQYEIPAFNPANLSVWFDTEGQSGFSFEYSWINESGVQSEPATFLVNATGPLAILPVELTSFDVLVVGNDVALTWTTASEKNNDRFEIERSNDGINFEKVGTVQGNGTTSLPQAYNFTDINPGVGVHYYRLKQVDFDAQFEYSKIKSAEIVGTVSIRTYPNPAQNLLNIEVKDTRLGDMNGVIIMFNTAGSEVIRESMVGSNIKQINVSDLPSGTYLLRYQSEEMISTFKVIISH